MPITTEDFNQDLLKDLTEANQRRTRILLTKKKDKKRKLVKKVKNNSYRREGIDPNAKSGIIPAK